MSRFKGPVRGHVWKLSSSVRTNLDILLSPCSDSMHCRFTWKLIPCGPDTACFLGTSWAEYTDGLSLQKNKCHIQTFGAEEEIGFAHTRRVTNCPYHTSENTEGDSGKSCYRSFHLSQQPCFLFMDIHPFDQTPLSSWWAEWGSTVRQGMVSPPLCGQSCSLMSNPGLAMRKFSF